MDLQLRTQSLGPAAKAMYYAFVSNIIAHMEDCRIRARASGDLVEVLLLLSEMRVAVLRLVCLEVTQKHKVGALAIVEITAYTFRIR